MRLRHLTAALLVVPALVLAACSGDDDEPKDTTATTSSIAPAEETTTTLSDEEYQEATGRGTEAVEASGGDLCAIIQASSEFPVPTTSEQVESTVGLIQQTYDAIAESLRESDPTSADALVAGAAAIVEEARAAGFPGDFFTGEPPAAMSDPAFQAGLQAIQTKYAAECGTPTQDGAGAGAEGDAGTVQPDEGE